MSLTTFARVAAEIKGTVPASSPTEQQVMGYIRDVSRRMEGYGFYFEPYYYTRRLTPTRGNVNSRLATLTLGDDLLEPDSIAIGTQTATYGTDILAYPGDSQTPIRQLRIANPYSGPIRAWYPCCVQLQSFIESIAITGYWGMRRQYTAMGFFSSAQTCPVLTTTQTSFAVSNVGATDIYNRTPMFSPGNLLRIDDELMEVAATNTSTNTLSVLRGMRGTTGATHSNGTTIYIWEPEESISYEATRQTALLYARRGAFNEVTSGAANITYPSDLLASLLATVQQYNYIV